MVSRDSKPNAAPQAGGSRQGDNFYPAYMKKERHWDGRLDKQRKGNVDRNISGDRDYYLSLRFRFLAFVFLVAVISILFAYFRKAGFSFFHSMGRG